MDHDRTPIEGQSGGREHLPGTDHGVGGERDTNAPSRWALNTGSSGASVAGAGLQFAVSILLFLFVGQWLDGRFGTTPWATLIGVMVGAVAGFTSLYRRLMAELEREEVRKKG